MKKIKFNGDVENIEKLTFLEDYNGDYFLYMKGNEIINNYYEINGEKYTETQIDNFMMSGEIFYCEDCNSYFFSEDEIAIHDDSGNVIKIVCEECANNNYYKCCECDEYYEHAHDTTGGDYVCDSCIDYYNYVCCDDCGYWTREGDARLINDTYYCDDCAEYHEDESNNIYGYHDFDDWTIYKTARDTEKDFLIGFENEIDDGDDEATATGAVYSNLNAVCMRDGSLDCGFEIVSHPQSFNYIMDNKENLKKTFQTLIDCGYRSHDTNTCGLHFHVTAPKENRDIVVSRLWAILETYKNEVLRLSRRNDSQLHWCKWLTDDRPQKNIEYYHIKNMSKDFTRYLAINNTNNRTIEFRFFRGTLNYETFLAAVEFINNLYSNAMDLQKPLTSIDWDTLTQGNYINNYVNEKDIKTDRKIVDNYEEIIKHDYIIEYELKKIIKMLSNANDKYYKSKIEELKKTKKDYYYIFSNINNDDFKTLEKAKNYLRNKNYNETLSCMWYLISKYINNSSNIGAKTLVSAYDNASKHIKDLEVILCA